MPRDPLPSLPGTALFVFGGLGTGAVYRTGICFPIGAIMLLMHTEDGEILKFVLFEEVRIKGKNVDE